MKMHHYLFLAKANHLRSLILEVLRFKAAPKVAEKGAWLRTGRAFVVVVVPLEVNQPEKDTRTGAQIFVCLCNSDIQTQASSMWSSPSASIPSRAQA